MAAFVEEDNEATGEETRKWEGRWEEVGDVEEAVVREEDDVEARILTSAILLPRSSRRE